MTEYTSEQRQARGQQAESFLAHPLIREILSDLDGEYHARWRDAKTVEAREDLHRYVKVVERLSADLLTIAQTGQLERARIKELEGKKGIQWPTTF